MPTYIRGAALWSSELADKIVVDMAPDIAMLEKDKVPLLCIMSKIKPKVAENFKYGHLEDELSGLRDAINNGAGYTAGATSIVVDDSTIFAIRMIIKIPRTSECMLVTGVTTGTHTLAVTRAFGETSAAAIVDNDEVEIIGSSHADNSGAQDAIATKETYVHNYTQLFKDSVQFGYRNLGTKKYGGVNQRAWRQRKMGITHAIQIEKAFWFGERKHDTTTDATTTRGIIRHLDAASVLVSPTGGWFTHYEWEEFLRNGFRYSASGGPGGTKVWYCSEIIMSYISSWASEKLVTSVGDTEFGLGIQTYISPHGRVKLVKNFHFQGNTYGYYGALLDMRGIQLRYLDASEVKGVGNWNTKLFTDKQAPSTHGTLDIWISDVGIEFKQPKWHRGMSGATNG